jgi:hypothetical protein
MMEDLILEHILIHGPWAFGMFLALPALTSVSLYRSYVEMFMGSSRHWDCTEPAPASWLVVVSRVIVVVSVIMSIYPQR